MKPTRSRSDWLLAGVAISLLGIWFALQHQSHNSQLDTKHPFANLDEHPPTELTVALSEQQVVVRKNPFRDSDLRYVPAAPELPPIDPSEVDRLLLGLQAIEVIREVQHTGSTNELGITRQSLTVTVRGGRTDSKIILGRESPSPEGGRYATIQTDETSRLVVLAPGSTSALDVTPDRLIDRRFTDWVPSDIRLISLALGGKTIQLRQAETGRYWISNLTPERYADRVAVDELLLKVTQLKVEHYLSQQKNHEPKVSAQDSLTLEGFEPSRTQQLSFGAQPEPCPDGSQTNLVSLSLDNRNWRLGCISRAFFDGLPRLATALLDRRLFFLHYDEVERMTGTSPTGHLVLERQGSTFRLLEPVAREVSLNAGNTWLKSLTQLEGLIVGECDPKDARFSSKFALYSGLVGRTGPLRDSVSLAVADRHGIRQACRDDGTLLEIDSGHSGQFDLDPSLLAPLELLHLPDKGIEELWIQNTQGEQHLVADETGHLHLVQPSFEEDAASIESLVEQLSQLSADRWVRRTDYQDALAARATVVVKLKVQRDRLLPDDGLPSPPNRDQQETHELRVYNDGRGRSIALLDNHESPFVLGTRTAELLSGLLANRSAYRLIESDRAFSLLRGKSQVRCEKRPTEYHCHTLPAGIELSPEDTKAAIETLVNLRATRVELRSRALEPSSFVLRIDGTSKGTQIPRLTLNFASKNVGTQSIQWFGTVPGTRLTYTYDDLRPLTKVFAGFLEQSE